MAATSPFDGRPSDPPDSGPTSFTRSIKPPKPDLEERLLALLHVAVKAFVDVVFLGHRFVWAPFRRLAIKTGRGALRALQQIGRVLFCICGGGVAIAFYCVLFPSATRYFQPLPPWGPEAPIIFGVFIAFTGTLWLLSWKRKGD